MSNNLVTGTVSWFNHSKGFGFIERQEGPSAFVHHTALMGQSSKSLKKGQVVKFKLVRSLRGFQAEGVVAPSVK